jgi:two-component system, OmpR family, response regulator
MQLLMVNEDKSDADWLAARLSPAGFVVQWHASVSLALDAGRINGAAAILLIDGTKGLELASSVRSIRSARVDAPLLVLATSDDWRAKVDCLDEGADDVILKPVRSEEIGARLRAIIRRSAGRSTDRIQIGPIDLDLKARCAWLKGKCLDLTRGEFRLLRLLMLNHGRTVSHVAILEQLARQNVWPSINAVEVQVARLRRKLDEGQIRTMRGVGYRFVVDNVPPTVVEREPCRAASDLPCNYPAANDVELDDGALMI